MIDVDIPVYFDMQLYKINGESVAKIINANNGKLLGYWICFSERYYYSDPECKTEKQVMPNTWKYYCTVYQRVYDETLVAEKLRLLDKYYGDFDCFYFGSKLEKDSGEFLTQPNCDLLTLLMESKTAIEKYHQENYEFSSIKDDFRFSPAICVCNCRKLNLSDLLDGDYLLTTLSDRDEVLSCDRFQKDINYAFLESADSQKNMEWLNDRLTLLLKAFLVRANVNYDIFIPERFTYFSYDELIYAIGALHEDRN